MNSRYLKHGLLILALMASWTMAGTDVGGKDLPATMAVGSETLNFNGAGLRKKLFIKVYAGALYLKTKSSDRAKVLAADETMAIRMHFIYSEVGQDKLIEAWTEGFETALGSKLLEHKAHIDAFNALFTKAAKADEVYDIIYVPGTGIEVHINGTKVGTVNGGAAFKAAVFGIWLGENSGLKDLGDDMLGL